MCAYKCSFITEIKTKANKSISKLKVLELFSDLGRNMEIKMKAVFFFFSLSLMYFIFEKLIETVFIFLKS